MQLLLDAALQLGPRLAFRRLAFRSLALRSLALRSLARAHPIPLLDQQFPVLPVGLQIERGDNLLAKKNRQGEITELAFGLRHIGLEAMLVIEDEMGALALDDQGIEGRQDVHERG